MSRDASEVREAGVPYRGDHAVRDGAGNRHAGSGEEGVPEGYKRTEVGVIPEEWDTKRLGEIGNFFKGRGIRRDQVTDEGVPCIRYGEIYTTYGDHTDQLYSYVPENVAREAFSLRRGDLLFAGSGETVEEIGTCVAYLGDERACAGGDIVILRPVEGVPAFFGSLLNHVSVTSQKSRLGQGDAVVHISARNLAQVEILVPPEQEQIAIAEALSDADRLIESLDKLIAKKRAVKQAAMQQLLTGKTRLRGFSGEWETKRLGEVAEIYSGGTPSTQVPEFWDGDIPWCTPTDITASNDKYLFSTATRISKSGLARSGATMLPRGALLLCSRATVGEVKIATVATCTNQGFKSLVCRPGCHNEFLFYLVLTLKGKFVEKASGSTFLEVGREGVSSIVIPMPQYGEQTAIANVLSDIDAEIDALEKRRDKAKAVKQGMMQELLTGRIRLVKPETTAAS